MSTKKLQIIGGAMLQPDWNETDPTFAAFIKNKPEFPTSALSGSYNDLKDKPVIDYEISEGSKNAVAGGVVYSELAKKANTADLSPVATSGSYYDLETKLSVGNEIEAGVAKLYAGSGDNIDGAMTQKATSAAIYNSSPKVQSVTMPYESWEGSGPYTQKLSISGLTNSSKIDMQADASTISAIVSGEFSITIKNDNGVVTAYAVGKKPALDLTLQLIVTEVIKTKADDVVWGSPLVGTGLAGSFVASAVAPTDLHRLWIDTAHSNLLKYHNGLEWVAISAAWG